MEEDKERKILNQFESNYKLWLKKKKGKPSTQSLNTYCRFQNKIIDRHNETIQDKIREEIEKL